MQKIFTIILLVFSLSSSYAAHIVGGEIYYDCLGNDDYRVTLKIYRDCNSGAAQYDSPLILGAYRQSNNTLYNVYNIPFPGSAVLPVVFNNPCVSPPNNICIEEAIYTTVINLPASPDGYTLTYQRCCRGPAIINLTNPDMEGLTLTTKIPGTSTGVLCNSSPRFNNYPPLLLCNNEELVFDHSATDPDGDELVYEFTTPFNGGTQFQPLPNPPTAPPYTPVLWENNFDESQPFGTSGPVNLNPASGLLNAAPDLLGKFVMSVTAKEYRNGVLINETIRDFIFTVFNCEVTLSSIIVPQEDLDTFVSYCEGLTISFENNSFGGTNYFWDFDDPNNPNSTSTEFEPTYTFSEPGIYNVTLVVNPGWTCTDSMVQTFQVLDELTSFYEPPDPQCITGNSFNFLGQGDYLSTATFNWDFGPNATPSSANTEGVNNVVFDTSGYIPVTFTAELGICLGVYTDSILVYPEPKIDFTADTSFACAPHSIGFYDLGETYGLTEYYWDFGDGNQSNLENPVHTYQNPGVYIVTLQTNEIDGCETTLTLIKENLVEVFPSPIAQFSVSPEITDVYNPEIQFFDESIDSDEHTYYFNDSTFTEERNTSHIYLDGGYHYPYQIVVNSYGCSDTVVREIYIDPLTTLYVPNAFTPDGDERNPVFLPIVYDVTEYHLSIYNRWGERIFETSNKNEGWNGEINGRPAPEGVYIWQIRLYNHKEIGEEHIGHFSLLR